MLSKGQTEIRNIIDSFLDEYEKLKEANDTHKSYYNLYEKVLNSFDCNIIIKNDSVTSQPLGTSQYSINYLQWLTKNGIKEKIEPDFDEDFPKIDFPMKEILYDRDGNLEPAYKGGVKWDSTLSCLFGLAQGKLLNSEGWNSIYYDAIELWKVGGGGHHRLLSHILFGSNEINPSRLTIIRNDSVDPLLNESLCQFDELFENINSDRKYYVYLAFDVELLTENSMAKIKNFFHEIDINEKNDLIRCINAIKEFPHEYISNDLGSRRIDIDDMYLLLSDIRNLRSKPHWYRNVLILKQRLLGIRTVDTITCSVLQLATWDKPYWQERGFNDKGLLHYLPGLRELLLTLFNFLGF